jgi:hypothetical protein
MCARPQPSICPAVPQAAAAAGEWVMTRAVRSAAAARAARETLAPSVSCAAAATPWLAEWAGRCGACSVTNHADRQAHGKPSHTMLKPKHHAQGCDGGNGRLKTWYWASVADVLQSPSTAGVFDHNEDKAQRAGQSVLQARRVMLATRRVLWGHAADSADGSARAAGCKQRGASIGTLWGASPQQGLHALLAA